MRKSRRGGGNNNKHQSQSQFNNDGTGEMQATPPLNEQAGEAEVAPPPSNGIGEPDLPEYSNNGNGNGSANGREEPRFYSPIPENEVAQSNQYSSPANGVEQPDAALYSNPTDNLIEPKPYSSPAPAPSNNGIGRRRRKAVSPLINSRNEPNNPPPLLSDYDAPDPKLHLPGDYGQPGTIPQLTGAVGPYEPEPAATPNGPNRPWRKTFPFQQYIVPGLLLLALLVGVFILAYGIGSDRGKRAANDERDAFYQERIARLVAASGPTVTPGASITPGTPSGTLTAGPNAATTQTYARIDKIEGDRITVLLLGPNGLPTGVSLVVVTGKTSQVYKSSETQPTELRPGDNVVVNTEKNGDNYIVRTIIVLPVAT